MNNSRKLNHTTYDCKYHIVWIPKYRKKAIYGQLRKYLGEVFRDLALQRESEILEGHLRGDHVHMLISIGCNSWYKKNVYHKFCIILILYGFTSGSNNRQE